MDHTIIKPQGHPILELLMKFVKRELPPVLHSYVEEHVHDCKSCQRLIVNNMFRKHAA